MQAKLLARGMYVMSAVQTWFTGVTSTPRQATAFLWMGLRRVNPGGGSPARAAPVEISMKIGPTPPGQRRLLWAGAYAEFLERDRG